MALRWRISPLELHLCQHCLVQSILVIIGNNRVSELLTSCATTLSTSTFSLSILVRTINFGFLCLLHSSHAFSVPTCTPADASTMIIDDAAVLSAERISPLKSNNPGVSRKLYLYPWYSTGTRVVLIEMLLSQFPSCRNPMLCCHSSTLPILVIAPVASRAASRKVVLPQPPCPKSMTFLILSVE